MLRGREDIPCHFLFAIYCQTPIPGCVVFDRYVLSAYWEQGSVFSSEGIVNVRNKPFSHWPFGLEWKIVIESMQRKLSVRGEQSYTWRDPVGKGGRCEQLERRSNKWAGANWVKGGWGQQQRDVKTGLEVRKRGHFRELTLWRLEWERKLK